MNQTNSNSPTITQSAEPDNSTWKWILLVIAAIIIWIILFIIAAIAVYYYKKRRYNMQPFDETEIPFLGEGHAEEEHQTFFYPDEPASDY